MDVPLSFCGWLLVLLIQVAVHLLVIYRRGRTSELEEEALLLEAESSEHSPDDLPNHNSNHNNIKYPEKEGISLLRDYKYRPSDLRRMNSDPALDDDDTWEFDEDPPNLVQRLSQTGGEMMSSCKSLEHLVQEQILAQ